LMLDREQRYTERNPMCASSTSSPGFACGIDDVSCATEIICT
jgi:hypothetical protein